QAGDAGADGLERAADLGRGVGLEVEQVQVARPAVGPEQNDGEVLAERAPLPGVLLGGEQARQAGRDAADQRAETEAADLEPAASVQRSGAGRVWGGGHEAASCGTGQEGDSIPRAIIPIPPDGGYSLFEGEP